MDEEEDKKQKNHRATKAGRGHDEKANKSRKEGQYQIHLGHQVPADHVATKQSLLARRWRSHRSRRTVKE